jgi:hypothetical protein
VGTTFSAFLGFCALFYFYVHVRAFLASLFTFSRVLKFHNVFSLPFFTNFSIFGKSFDKKETNCALASASAKQKVKKKKKTGVKKN